MGQVKKITSSDFVRNILKLMSGNFAAQLIAIGSVPFITRLFTPESFGLLAIYIAIMSIYSKVGSLCYERAILLPKEEADAAHILVVSLSILFFVVSVSTILTQIYAEAIAGFLSNAALESWLFMIPLGALAVGISNIVRYWSLRQKKFGSMSYSHVGEALISAAIKIVVGVFVGDWVGGLLLGALVGSITAVVILLQGSSLWSWRKVSSWCSSVRLKELAVEYKQFPLYASINALLNVLSLQMVVFFLSSLYSPAIVGFYNLATRMLRQPATLVSESVAKVYFQKSASQHAEKTHLAPGLVKTIVGLCVMAILPFVCLALYGQEVFVLVFGEQWLQAGVFAEIMTPWFFIIFISGPAAIIFEVCKRQKFKLWINVSTAAAGLLALYYTNNSGAEIVKVLEAFVVVNVCMGLVQIIVAIWIAKSSDKHMLQQPKTI